jgi:hypothetical protein
MYAIRDELADLKRQLAETIVQARAAHNNQWRLRHERSARSLELAVAELQSRVPLR